MPRVLAGKHGQVLEMVATDLGVTLTWADGDGSLGPQRRRTISRTDVETEAALWPRAREQATDFSAFLLSERASNLRRCAFTC